MIINVANYKACLLLAFCPRSIHSESHPRACSDMIFKEDTMNDWTLLQRGELRETWRYHRTVVESTVSSTQKLYSNITSC